MILRNLEGIPPTSGGRRKTVELPSSLKSSGSTFQYRCRMSMTLIHTSKTLVVRGAHLAKQVACESFYKSRKMMRYLEGHQLDATHRASTIHTGETWT